MATQNLPQPTKGPYSLDLDDLFDQASESVRAHAGIVIQLNTLEDPPDLEDIFVSQREVLAVSVQELVARCTVRANRLHDILVAILATDLTRIAQLGTLAAVATLDPSKAKQANRRQVDLLTDVLPAARE